MSSDQPDPYHCIAELFIEELKPGAQAPLEGGGKDEDFDRIVIGKLERSGGAVRLILTEQLEVDADLAEDIRLNTQAIRDIFSTDHIRVSGPSGEYENLAEISDEAMVKAIQSSLGYFLVGGTAIVIEAV